MRLSSIRARLGLSSIILAEGGNIHYRARRSVKIRSRLSTRSRIEVSGIEKRCESSIAHANTGQIYTRRFRSPAFYEAHFTARCVAVCTFLYHIFTHHVFSTIFMNSNAVRTPASAKDKFVSVDSVRFAFTPGKTCSPPQLFCRLRGEKKENKTTKKNAKSPRKSRCTTFTLFVLATLSLWQIFALAMYRST